MKKILFASIAITFIAGASYMLVAFSTDQQDDESEQPFVVVQRKDISQSIIATGIIKPKVGAEVKVGAQVSGVVKNLFVKTGSRVKMNDLLAVIDPRIYQSQKDKMLALREIAAAEKKYAEIEVNRQRTLFEQQAISLQQFETASQRFELADARLKQAGAEYEYADLQLGYTKIFSPIKGVVASISTQEGETVAAGFVSPTFVTIIDLDQLELWTYVDETDIGRIQKGQSVSFTVDTYPGESFEGTVETIYPKAEIQNNVVNYVAVVKITSQHDKILRPEMTATVQTFTRRKEHALAIPKNAVQTENDRMFVTILSNGKAERRYISTGISDKKYYEVLSGVNEKEKVILK
ncbi:MAG: efflux RND transporter periplasmic adaptor subunit [Ignavibacteriales bacterium]|nr:efflux RND transporter periplasmic adaptor subunit [Ignavibacteriales bacterium]